MLTRWPQRRFHSGEHHAAVDHPQPPEQAGLPARVGHRRQLARGVGVSGTVFFDAPSGAGGDMIVGALIDLGVPWQVIEQAIDALPLSGVTLRAQHEHCQSISAQRFIVDVDEGKQVSRDYAEVLDLINRSRLSPRVQALSQSVFLRLAQAEAKVHGIEIADVHFHEVGAADSLADIVGACAALEYLGATIACSPLPLGRGYVACQHGRIPLPAPATLECLVGLDTYDGGLDVELVTPTAAALLGALSTQCVRWPGGQPVAVGWGKGSRALPDRPNVLRVVLLQGSVGDATAASTCVLLEANLDDIDGERLGHAIGQLLEHGALDAWATPITMKKGRPAWTLSALCRPSQAIQVEGTLFRETTTLGVRRTRVERTELARETKHVRTEYGVVPIKVAGSISEGTYRVKPEFEVCRDHARHAQVAVWVVSDAARVLALNQCWSEPPSVLNQKLAT